MVAMKPIFIEEMDQYRPIGAQAQTSRRIPLAE